MKINGWNVEFGLKEHVNFMNIFNNRGILRILGKAFQQMEALVSSLYARFGKDESFFQLLFGLPQVLAIT